MNPRPLKNVSLQGSGAMQEGRQPVDVRHPPFLHPQPASEPRSPAPMQLFWHLAELIKQKRKWGGGDLINCMCTPPDT